MSKFRTLFLEALILAESEAKVDFLLKNKNLEDDLRKAIQNDPEIENKNLTPKELLLQWDKDDILSKNMPWVAKQYLNNMFYFGDIYKVKADLAKFEKYKNKKSLVADGTLKSSDINSYNYSDLKQDLDKIDDNNVQNLGSSARKNAVEQGKDEADKVYEDEDWIVIVPKTQAAAMYWGKHTRWCTAADSENNKFNLYNKKGPLFIAINKNNPKDKYQACFEAGEYKDTADENGIVPKGTKVYEFLRNEAINRNAIKNWWYWFNEDEITDDMLLKALKDEKEINYNHTLNSLGSDIEVLFMNKDIEKSDEFAKKAIKINPEYIYFITDPSSEVQIEYINYIWNEYVKKRWDNPKFEPRDLHWINNELSDEAKAYIKKLEDEEQVNRRQKQIDEYIAYAKNGRFSDIPENERTYDMYLLAIKAEKPYHRITLAQIPDQYKDKQMYQAYAENNLRYGILQEIPKQYLTNKICLDAVKANKYNFLDVPDKFKTLEMCKIVTANYYENDIWDAIPDKFKPFI